MTLSPHQERVSATERRDAVAEAIASIRAEGLELDSADHVLFDGMADGQLSVDEVRERLLARYAA